MLRCLFLVLCLIGLPFQSMAQTEDWPDVVIKAKTTVGPAMWRVSDEDSQVIIIGILPVFPKKQAWNTKRIENALRGANVLITPATSHAGAGDMTSLMFRKGLPDGKTLKQVLSPALYARYEAAAARAKVSIRDFARDKPVWAMVRLRREVLEKRGLTDDEPVATIKRLAGRAGVPVRAAANYDMGAIVKDINAMTPQAAEVCVTATLDDIDFLLDRLGRTAAAWAVGDLATVRANYPASAMARCLSGSSKGSALMDRSINDSVAAVEKALKKPGKSVAVLPLAILLRRGATLDRLRAKGYEVSAP
ncbi:conjugative transfer protein GumN [Asticcacaulis sp. AC460]|uniref:TraB/GumN family protein n=1 Tax=Asticcacaulis sp. AC460 TaxID=1282360 RepID=UPI0003C3BEEB|nr:TraB/GumN family protein [Asticcacaulis sp. AC460]ESQ92738.1 conjugative transfer protein GumN [Asticcacaulis sp. AC460]